MNPTRNATYPFEPGRVLVDDAWYVAAWSSDDRCPHRSSRLSMGRVVGDDIECGYHGFTFDAAGRCVRIADGEPRFELSCAAGEASLKGRQVVQRLLRE